MQALGPSPRRNPTAPGVLQREKGAQAHSCASVTVCAGVSCGLGTEPGAGSITPLPSWSSGPARGVIGPLMSLQQVTLREPWGVMPT